MAKDIGKTDDEGAAAFKALYGYAREDETNAQAFKRVGTRRLNQAADAIRLLESLSNKAQYEYTPEQVKTVIDTLVASVNKVHEAFKAGKPQVAGGVSL